jgi:thiol:disulfide interchange protein DsbC
MKVRLLFFTLVAVLSVLTQQVPAAEIDFSKAITIGSGSKKVVEFTDPDCPHCRRAAKYFEGRTDLTRQIFFYPLARHPKAREKAQFVLSMPDKAKAYHEVMSGKMDSVANLPSTPEGVKLLEQHIETAKKSKVSSTPTFMINVRIIEGFDLKRMEEVLGPRP